MQERREGRDLGERSNGPSGWSLLTPAANEQQAGGVAERLCIASNVGQQEAAGSGAQGVCEGKRPGAGPRGPARAGQQAGPRRAADCSAARSLGLSQRRGAESDLPGTACGCALCLGRRDSEARGALRTVRGSSNSAGLTEPSSLGSAVRR